MTTNDKLLNGSGLSTVLGLLKDKLDQKISFVDMPQSNWTEAETTSLAYIRNKPDLNALTPYVTKSSVTPITGITGTAIATIDGKTIYAPAASEQIYNVDIDIDMEHQTGQFINNDSFSSIKQKIESGVKVVARLFESGYIFREISDIATIGTDGIVFTCTYGNGTSGVTEIGSANLVISDNGSIYYDEYYLNNAWGRIYGRPDMTRYVAKAEVSPVPGVTGTAIATVGGVTIYAPVSEEGITTETDPIFSASPAASITATDISRWNAITTSITSTLDSRYVNITGDTMTGALMVESNTADTDWATLDSSELSFGHSPLFEGVSYEISISRDSDTGLRLLSQHYNGTSYPVTIGGVATPSLGDEAANKQYVDDTVAAITSTIDPESVYYVDAEWIYNPNPVMSVNPTRDVDVVAGSIDTTQYVLQFTNSTTDNYDSIKAKIDAGKNVVLRINTTILPNDTRDVSYAILQSESSEWYGDDADVLTFASFATGKVEVYQIVKESFTSIIYDEIYTDLSKDTVGAYIRSIESNLYSGTLIAEYVSRDQYGNLSYNNLYAPAQVNADWNATTGVSTILNKPDLNNYVLANSVISTGPTNGTAIANISGVTIYAPVAQGGVIVESDPVFTAWATGNGIAAYTITASDVEKWNGITGYVPKEVTGGTITFEPGNFAVDIQDQNENLSSIAATTNNVEIWVGEGATESSAVMRMNIQNDGAHLNLNAQHLKISSNDTRISGVITPTSNTDAANKLYVDSQINSVTTGLTNYVPKQVIGNTTATTITVGSDGFKVEAFTNNQENISSVSVNPVNGKIELTAGEYANEHYAGIELGGENGKSYIYMQANDVAILGVTTPTYPHDAANKKYVDDQISGITTGLTNYVAKTDVTPAAGITGTIIATIGGKTIYAPVSEEGIQSETDPVFTASAAYGITATDIANWNAKSSITPIQSDWNQSSTTALDFIKNKPTISDRLVEQNPVSVSGITYPILIKGTSGVSAATATAGFTESIYANPGTGLLHVNTLTGSLVSVGTVSAHTTTIRDQEGMVAYTIQGDVTGHGDQTNLYIKSNMHHDDIITVTDYGQASKSNISFNNNPISGITTPTSDDQPANKKYVDDAISAVTTTVLDSGVLYADITGTTSLTSSVTYANIVAATPTKAVMLRRNGDIYQLAKAASTGLEFRVVKPLEIDEIVMTSTTISYNEYLTIVSGTTLTIEE